MIEGFMKEIKSVQVYFDCDVKKMTIRNSAEASSLHTEGFYWMVVFLLCGFVSPAVGEKEGR